MLNTEGMRPPVGRPDFKSGKGYSIVLGGFDSHSFPPSVLSGTQRAKRTGALRAHHHAPGSMCTTGRRMAIGVPCLSGNPVAPVTNGGRPC
jgi:hypothetical protein